MAGTLVPLATLPDLPVFRDRNSSVAVEGGQEADPEYTDLRSDTVTLPTRKMRELIANAPVGDDCYQDDEEVIALQTRLAEMFGKEAALFMPSGTMANLVGIMGHCPEKGDSVIIGRESHLRRWERGNLAAVGNVMPLTVDNDAEGQLHLDQVLSYIADFQDDDPHFCRIKAIAVESTHNFRGGSSIPMAHLAELSEIAKKNGLKLHLDGARVLNACAYLNLSPEEYCGVFDTVSVCLSKGLGCPIGSVLLGSRQTIDRAWALRKVLGGNLRQIGGLAQAAMHSLDTWEESCSLDHQMA